jgi:hypothetical protein
VFSANPAGRCQTVSPAVPRIPSGGNAPTLTFNTSSPQARPAMAGKPIEIRLLSTNLILDDDPDSANFAVYFDDIQLTTTAVVSVPAAAWLFGSALGLIGVMRRKLHS